MAKGAWGMVHGRLTTRAPRTLVLALLLTAGLAGSAYWYAFIRPEGIVKPSLSGALDEFYGAQVSEGEVALLWLGLGRERWAQEASAAFLIKVANKVVLIDPSNIISGGDVARVQRLDIILITHEHSDHFDASATVDIQRRTGSYVVANPGAHSLLEGKVPTGRLRLIREGESGSFAGVEVRAIGSVHPGDSPLTYLISVDGITIFHGSDSGFNPDLLNYRGLAQIALVPTGEPSPTASPQDAMRMAKALGTGKVITMHGTMGQGEELRALLDQQMPQAELIRPEALKAFKLKL